MTDINWDCYTDPPYHEPTDEEIEEMKKYVDTSFIEDEDEEIRELLKKEPKFPY